MKLKLLILFGLIHLKLFPQQTGLETVSVYVYRSTAIRNDHYYISDEYPDGRMLKYGEYISIKPYIEDGLFKYYDEYGQIYATGRYINGRLTGKWIYYSEDKLDTVDYSYADKYLKGNIDTSFKIVDHRNISIEERFTVVNDIINFIDNNIQIPARVRPLDKNFRVNMEFVVDTNGFIRCPKFIDSINNIDFKYESLRCLFKYKSIQKISEPIEISMPLVFKSEKKSYLELKPMEEYKPAMFEGGNIDYFTRWVQKNINYSQEAAINNIQGTVLVQFAVNSKGKL